MRPGDRWPSGAAAAPANRTAAVRESDSACENDSPTAAGSDWARRPGDGCAGAWLSDRVWATHGHYIGRRVRADGPRARPIDFEGVSRNWTLHRIEAGIMRTLPTPAATVTEDLAELARAFTMPLPRRLLHRRMSPMTSALLALQVRRASIPTLADVAARLGVDADWILFGHVHRLGPLAGDRPADWQGPGAGPSIANTGSWVYEPLLVHHVTPPHPYWPGGSVLLEDNAPPVARGLLDDLPADALL